MSQNKYRPDSAATSVGGNSIASQRSKAGFGNNVEDFKKDPRFLVLFTADEIEQYKGLFDMFDVDGGQTISQEELMQIMKELGENPTEEEVALMIKEVDDDGSGEIDFYEFCLMLKKKNDEGDKGEEMIRVFNLFSKGKDTVNHRMLRESFVELGVDLSMDDCKLLI